MSIRSTLPRMNTSSLNLSERRTLPATTKLQAPTAAFERAEADRKVATAANQRMVSAGAGISKITLPSLRSIDPEDRGLYLDAARSIAADKSQAAQAKFSAMDSPHIKTIDDYIAALQATIQNGYSGFA